MNPYEMRPEIPPYLAEQLVAWDGGEARFVFAAGPIAPPAPIGRWLMALSPAMIGGIIALAQYGATIHGDPPIVRFGPVAVLIGTMVSALLLLRNKPWVPIDPGLWQEAVRRATETRFDFTNRQVRDGQGQVIGRFEDFELAIHVGQCFGEAMFTVTVPGCPGGDGWYLAVFDGTTTRTFFGPGTLPEMEAVGRHLLQHHPFKCVRNYVATIRDEFGRERPTTSYFYERQILSGHPPARPGDSQGLTDPEKNAGRAEGTGDSGEC